MPVGVNPMFLPTIAQSELLNVFCNQDEHAAPPCKKINDPLEG
jgi:hypothetical protein